MGDQKSYLAGINRPRGETICEKEPHFPIGFLDLCRGNEITEGEKNLSRSIVAGCRMDLSSPHNQMSLAALVVALLALGFSSLAAFPGLKSMLVVVRDGVLWLALFFVLGGAGFIVWQRLEQARPAAAAVKDRLTPVDPLANRPN